MLGHRFASIVCLIYYCTWMVSGSIPNRAFMNNLSGIICSSGSSNYYCCVCPNSNHPQVFNILSPPTSIIGYTSYSPIVSVFPPTLVTDGTTAKATAKRRAGSCLFSLPLVLWTISSFGGESRQAHTGRGLKPRNSVRTVCTEDCCSHPRYDPIHSGRTAPGVMKAT